MYLYDTLGADISKASRMKLPKARSKEDLGPVIDIETTEGKNKKVTEKYGVENGLVVRN